MGAVECRWVIECDCWCGTDENDGDDNWCMYVCYDEYDSDNCDDASGIMKMMTIEMMTALMT